MKKATLLLPLAPLLFLTACGQPKEPEVTKIYTITFVDGDGHTLLTTQVEEGTYPVYEGDTPTKDADFPHEYVYTGWDKEITKATEDTTYTATFDYVFLFGTYPQKLVSDPELIEHIESEGTSGPLDYVTYDGKYYYQYEAKVNFVADDGTYVYAQDMDYYEVLPIRWKILGDEANKFYTTYNLLDTGLFNDDTPTPPATHPNNYKYSDMRTWMNQQTEGGFMWRAFSAEERDDIDNSDVRNDEASTMETDNDYTCDDTQEYVFALSHEELRDPDLGFSTEPNLDKSRLALTTDFARAAGAGVVNKYGLYWTRSPSQLIYAQDLDNYVYNVLTDGAVQNTICSYSGRCIRPAIKLL